MSSDGEDFWFGIKLGLVWASPFWVVQMIMNGTPWGGHVGTLGFGAFFAAIVLAIQ